MALDRVSKQHGSNRGFAFMDENPGNAKLQAKAAKQLKKRHRA